MDEIKLTETEIALRFEDTVRRMANTRPAPTPAKPRASRRTSPEDKAIAALQPRIAAYFRSVAGNPSREDYIKTVLSSFPDGLIKTDFRLIAGAAPHPCVVATIDPLFDRLAAYAAEQWHRHVGPPTASAAPKSSV